MVIHITMCQKEDKKTEKYLFVHEGTKLKLCREKQHSVN